MPVIAAHQLGGFLICIISGVVLGIVYDIFAALRGNIALFRVFTILSDVVFWAVFAVIFFCTLQLFCSGEFYWFYLLGAVLGFILYLFTLGRIFMPIISKIVAFFVTGTKKFYGANMRILKQILHIFSPVCKIVVKFVQFVRKKAKKFVKKTVEIIRRFGVLLNKV